MVAARVIAARFYRWRSKNFFFATASGETRAVDMAKNKLASRKPRKVSGRRQQLSRKGAAPGPRSLFVVRDRRRRGGRRRTRYSSRPPPVRHDRGAGAV